LIFTKKKSTEIVAKNIFKIHHKRIHNLRTVSFDPNVFEITSDQEKWTTYVKDFLIQQDESHEIIFIYISQER
jgi:hypothetical protein